MAICNITKEAMHQNDPDIVVACQEYFDEFKFMFWDDDKHCYVYSVSGKRVPTQGEIVIIFRRTDGRLRVIDFVKILDEIRVVDDEAGNIESKLNKRLEKE